MFVALRFMVSLHPKREIQEITASSSSPLKLERSARLICGICSRDQHIHVFTDAAGGINGVKN